MAARALAIAALVTALLGMLLGAWWIAGSRDVDRQARELAAAPVDAAARAGREAAGDLRDQLAALVQRENARPYFHYQNLFRDPRASAGTSVTPSPLATGTGDPDVRGYFQIDWRGKVTTPRINDDVPALSDREHLVESERLVADVARDVAPALHTRGAVIAGGPPGAATGGGGGSGPHVAAQVAAQVVSVDPSVYAQNTNANQVFNGQFNDNNNVGNNVGNLGNANFGNTSFGNFGNANVAVANVAVPPSVGSAPHTTPPPAPPAAPVTITISPFAWRTLPIAGAPSLIALRRVQTPDGVLTQGFVVALPALAGTRTGIALQPVAASPAAVAPPPAPAPAPDNTELTFAPGWRVSSPPRTDAVATAALSAADARASFHVWFGAGAFAAVLAGLLIVLAVARSERVARERSQFAAAAAHELRTPLAGLQLYGDMLADGLGDPGKLRDYARRMSEEASRLGRVVANVLGVTQLERGTENLHIDARPGDLAAALRELADRAQPALDRAGAAIDLDVPDALAAVFDRDALARIVGNLVDNAEKYARGADDRTIQLAASPTPDGRGVEIVVRDRGAGVAAPSRLFHAFRRGVDASGPAGLGLGLALSRALARAMGGDLAYRAPADGGPGAAFVLRLPA